MDLPPYQIAIILNVPFNQFISYWLIKDLPPYQIAITLIVSSDQFITLKSEIYYFEILSDIRSIGNNLENISKFYIIFNLSDYNYWLIKDLPTYQIAITLIMHFDQFITLILQKKAYLLNNIVKYS